MTQFDYEVLQEDFSAHLYQNKFGSRVHNREGAFDEAILACKSILYEHFHYTGISYIGAITKHEYEELLDRFNRKLKPEHSWKKNDSKIIVYNSAIKVCESILENHYKKWGGKLND